MPTSGARIDARLTPGELRVIGAMKTARNEADAARRLGISVHTVHAHLRNARSRFGARSTRELLVTVLT